MPDRPRRLVWVIEIIGGLDLSTAPALDTLPVLPAVPPHVLTHVEVDLCALTFCDTAGLRALDAAVAGLQAAGAQVTVVGARRQVRTLLMCAAEHCWLTAAPILAAATPPPSTQSPAVGSHSLVGRVR